MIDQDRLDELETYRPADDAKVRIPVGDLRDLVSLIPVVRAALDWDPDAHYGVVRLSAAVDELRAKGAG